MLHITVNSTYLHRVRIMPDEEENVKIELNAYLPSRKSLGHTNGLKYNGFNRTAREYAAETPPTIEP